MQQICYSLSRTVPKRPHLRGSHFSVVTLWVGGLNPGIMLCCCDPGNELYKCRKSAKSLSVHSPPEYSATEETISWTSGGVTGQICTQTSSSATWWLISQPLALNRFQRLNKCNTIKQSCLLESGWALTVASLQLLNMWIRCSGNYRQLSTITTISCGFSEPSGLDNIFVYWEQNECKMSNASYSYCIIWISVIVRLPYNSPTLV